MNKWNRRTSTSLSLEESQKNEEFKVTRVRPKKRKKPHPGYTVIAKTRMWIFENNKKR